MEKTILIGDVGDRVEVAGVIFGLQSIPTEYGHSTEIKFRNTDGVLGCWVASNGDLAYSLKVGDVLTLRGTIKRYVQARSTGDLFVQLTRCTILENALALV